mmetsp:Transcript_9523/g.16556  ORF Transcript_9523/g.16556 Transcript_9523/m.16556 type:complete len:214 (+) Transcript_9523:105-746(+)
MPFPPHPIMSASGARFSPARILHITQRNNIWVVGGTPHLQHFCDILGNKRPDLQHVRVLQNGIQMLHYRFNLCRGECVEHGFERERRDGRGEPQRRVLPALSTVPINSKRLGYVNGVNNEMFWRGTAVLRTVVSPVVFVVVMVVVVFIFSNIGAVSGCRGAAPARRNSDVAVAAITRRTGQWRMILKQLLQMALIEIGSKRQCLEMFLLDGFR